MKLKKAGLLTKIIVIALLVYMATALLDLRTQVQASQAQQEDLRSQVEALAQENARLSDAIENSDDPDVLESVAQEKGWVPNGSTLFVDVAG